MSDSNTPTPPATSRRNFIRNSSATVAGTTLAGSLASRSYAAADDTIRIGLIGCGGRGTGAAAQALSTSGPTELVAMCDAFPDKVEQRLSALKGSKGKQVKVGSADKHTGFDGYKQLIDRDDVDLVILTTPPGFRPLHFEYAVQKGKNVFMEKPVASDAHGIRRVLAAAAEAKKKNLKVGVGLQRHHDVRYQETIKRIQDGAIGDVVTLRCYWNGGRPWHRARQEGQTEMEYQMRNWYYFNWLCGDHIVEQHIHNLDVCNWIMGGPPQIGQGQGGRTATGEAGEGEIFDHHSVEFTYGPKWDPESGPRMFSQCRHTRGAWGSVSEHVHGTKGYSLVGGGRLYDRKGNQVWKFETPRGQKRKNPYQVEHDVLFSAVRNNQAHNEAEYGATSTMTAIYGRMCNYSGKMLKWADALNSKIDVFPHDPAFQWSWKAKPPVVPDAGGNYPLPVPGRTKVV
ncbi:MAG: Gfo/Idh/MocA family oxidoreductase [Phycisphaerae bacterium]|nr:Gfo/Idh/MocA family oxidoreductase [Phycisphaerae bacterium]